MAGRRPQAPNAGGAFILPSVLPAALSAERRVLRAEPSSSSTRSAALRPLAPSVPAEDWARSPHFPPSRSLSDAGFTPYSETSQRHALGCKSFSLTVLETKQPHSLSDSVLEIPHYFENCLPSAPLFALSGTPVRRILELFNQGSDFFFSLPSSHLVAHLILFSARLTL